MDGEEQDDSIVTSGWMRESKGQAGCLCPSQTPTGEVLLSFTQADPDAAELDAVLCVEVCVCGGWGDGVFVDLRAAGGKKLKTVPSKIR